MPFATDLKSCDQNVLKELKQRYQDYLADHYRQNVCLLALYNLQAAGILSAYEQYQPKVLARILKTGQSIGEKAALELASLVPDDKSLLAHFRLIATGSAPLCIIELFAALNRHGLLRNKEIFKMIGGKRCSELAKAIDDFAKHKHPITLEFCLNTLNNCEKVSEYANAMIDLLYKKKDFDTAMTSTILKCLKRTIYPTVAMNLFRKLQSLHLLDQFPFEKFFHQTSGAIIFHFEPLLSVIQSLERYEIRITTEIFQRLLRSDKFDDMQSAIFRLDFNTVQSPLSPDERNTFLDFIMTATNPEVTVCAMLILRSKNSIDYYDLCLDEEKAYMIAELKLFIPECLETLKNMPSQSGAASVAMRIYHCFIEANPQLTSAATFISIYQNIAILREIVHSSQDDFFSGFKTGRVSENDFHELMQTCNDLIQNSLPLNMETESGKNVFRLLNKFTLEYRESTTGVKRHLSSAKNSKKSNKKSHLDDKPSIDDAKPVVQTLKGVVVPGQLVSQSFFNTQSMTTPIINTNNTPIVTTLQDCKTESDVVMATSITSTMNQPEGPRTIGQINADIAKLLTDPNLVLLLTNTDLKAMRNNALFNLKDDLKITLFIDNLKYAGSVHRDLPFFGDRLSLLLNERQDYANANANSNTLSSHCLSAGSRNL